MQSDHAFTRLCGNIRKAPWIKFSLEPMLESWRRTIWQNMTIYSISVSRRKLYVMDVLLNRVLVWGSWAILLQERLSITPSQDEIGKRTSTLVSSNVKRLCWRSVGGHLCYCYCEICWYVSQILNRFLRKKFFTLTNRTKLVIDGA